MLSTRFMFVLLAIVALSVVVLARPVADASTLAKRDIIVNLFSNCSSQLATIIVQLNSACSAGNAGLVASLLGDVNDLLNGLGVSLGSCVGGDSGNTTVIVSVATGLCGILNQINVIVSIQGLGSLGATVNGLLAGLGPTINNLLCTVDGLLGGVVTLVNQLLGGLGLGGLGGLLSGLGIYVGVLIN